MSDYQELDSYHFYEQEWDDYEQLREAFEWEVPAEFNIASYVCDRWADGDDRVATFAEDEQGRQEEITYGDIQRRANRLANFLEAQGVGRGDRVGICLSPSPEVIIGHVAVWKLGAISVPLSVLFGPDAMEYRLADCDASACLTGPSTSETVRAVSASLPNLESLVVVDEDTQNDQEIAYDTVQSEYAPAFETVTTDAEDSACIIYTSGTTGDPKGVVHAHRFILGILPLMCRCFMQDNTTDGEVWWIPVGWSWVGPITVIFSGLFYGVSIVAYDGGQFDPENAFEILETYGVSVFAGPPTMLRMMMEVDNPGDRFDVDSLDVIGTGGEKIEQATIDWADETFSGASIQDTYGQTESGGGNVADFAPLVPVRPEKMGVAMPGNEVRILDEDTGDPLGPGEVGEIAIRHDDHPGCFKEYWNKPDETAGKRRGDWLLTEDLGMVDEDGYFSYETRKDDVIISSGYKISPEEIEETLAKHSAVDTAGVIGVPHSVRGEIPRAYVSLTEGVSATDELKETLQAFVKSNLAKYEYPRELRFIDTLPQTATGKLSRHSLRERAGVADE